MKLNFIDSVKGAKVNVEMNKRIVCGDCQGTKAKVGTNPRKCYECGGRGSVMGNYGVKKRCLKCNGAGYKVKESCPTCEGLGIVRENVSEEVEFPAGLFDGQKIRIRGLGHASEVYRGLSGDLLLEIKVDKSDKFMREGNDIVTEADLTIGQAILGCKISVETIWGLKTIKVPDGV